MHMKASAPGVLPGGTLGVGRRARRRRALRYALVVLVLAYAATLRLWRIGSEPLWTDEAESSINAMTILQHGVPTGEYLGIPIFENTLTETWPESPEYEFRDTSYSRKGLAIYHGWLPLYAISASFALHGIEPDGPAGALAVKRGEGEMYRRTIAARLPSVVFGLVFLLAIFHAGREFYGEDAAWAGLGAAAVATTTVTLARQARYYSLTLALAALFALTLAHLANRGRRRDFVWIAVWLVLLFHANVLAFVGACGAFGVVALTLRREQGRILNLGIAGLILVAGILPWALLTGFVGAATNRPMVSSLLEWSDILRYPMDRALFVLLAACTLAWLAGAWLLGDRISRRVTEPFIRAGWVFLLMAAWACVAFAAFNLLIPAASYFHARLTIAVLVPALLFGAMLAAALARLILPRRSIELSVGLLLLLLYSSGRTTFAWPAYVPRQPPLFGVIEHMRSLDIRPGTRLYADTGASLPLTFYTGLPVQNIMPVRESFLDAHRGELLIVESPKNELLTWPDVQKELRREGLTVLQPEARRLAGWFNEEVVRAQVDTRVARLGPSRRPPPAAAVRSLAGVIHERTAETVHRLVDESGNPMFRGYDIRDYTTMWQVFFYRFADPDRRIGAHLNYAKRARSGEATLLPGGWVIIRSPALGPS